MHRNSSQLHFGHRWPSHFGCANGFLGLCHTFFGWGFILGHGAYWWSSFFGKLPSFFGHFFFMHSLSTFLFHMDSTSFFFLLVFFGRFQHESYVGIWGHYGSKIMGVFSGPISEASDLTTNILWWYRPSFYGGLCLICFSRKLGFCGSYLCSRFCIFNKFVLDEYVIRLKGPRLLQLCLRAAQDGLPLVTRDIHPSFKSLAVIGASSLQVFFMVIHHDTSLRSILEDDSISLASRARIHFCSGKGTWLWLIIKPSIRSLCIAYFTLIPTLHFHLSLIQPLASNLFTCECGHGLNAFDTHLVHCPFGGQWISTHDVIRNVMYALVKKKGHIVWKERWYALMSRISLQANLYMTQENQVFIVDVVVIDPTQETVASSVINWLAVQLWNLMSLLESANIESFKRGTILFQWPWRYTTHSSMIWIVSLGNVLIFFTINDRKVIYPFFFTFNFLNNMLVLFFCVL